MNREDIIAKAISLAYSSELAAKRRTELTARSESSKYERAEDRILAAALDDLVTDGLADEECGVADTHGHYARIEQWIVGTDSAGFVLLRDFKTVESAQEQFSTIEDLIRALDAEGSEPS